MSAYLVLDLSPETIDAMRARLERHLFGRAKTLSPIAPEPAPEDESPYVVRLDQAQRHALQAFRDGKSPAEQPNVTLRRIFDLSRMGLVQKVDGRYHLTPLGFTVWVAQS